MRIRWVQARLIYGGHRYIDHINILKSVEEKRVPRKKYAPYQT